MENIVVKMGDDIVDVIKSDKNHQKIQNMVDSKVHQRVVVNRTANFHAEPNRIELSGSKIKFGRTELLDFKFGQTELLGRKFAQLFGRTELNFYSMIFAKMIW